jgi:hypothetical protein
VTAAEAIGGQFYGLRPNSIRALVPYRAPNAGEVMTKAWEAFAKNPANKEAIEQGNLTGSVRVDVQGDGKPIDMPILDVAKAGGAQFDPQTGKLLIASKKDNPANVQLDDQVFLGEVAKFEADKGRPATSAERGDIARRVTMELSKARRQGTTSIVMPTQGEKPMSRYQRLTAERNLRADADKVLAPIRDMNRQVMVMRAGMEQIQRTGRLDAGTQAIINTFNRIMEPGSVTREAEYLRSTLGQPLFESLSGRWQSLTKGGAGVTPESLGLLVDLAENIVDSLSSGADARMDDLRAQAEEFQLPHERIVPKAESYRLPTRKGRSGSATPTTGAITVTAPDGKTYRFATQEQADAFKRAAGIK